MTEPATAAGRWPTFLLIGATKAGSTSVFDHLRTHPDVFMHPRKELRYFTQEYNLKRGPSWYREQFAGAGDARAVGEASNAYSRHPVFDGVPGRIAALLPDVRLVYLVREPFARLESHYRWRLSTGYEWRPPAEAFEADRSYVAASLYGLQLAEYRRHFAADRILVIRSEALFADPQPQLERLAAHLGVAHHPRLPFRRRNATRGRRVVAGPLRRLARGPLRRPIRRLGRAIARTPLGGLSAEAAQVEYRLPPELRARIAGLFEEDRRLLENLGGLEVADWHDSDVEEAPRRRHSSDGPRSWAART